MGSSSRTSAAWEAMFRPPKPKATAEFICPHCSKPCGWTKSEIIAIRGDHDLKCQNDNCKQTAIRVRTGSFSAEKLKNEWRGGNSQKIPFQTRKNVVR